MKHLTTGNLLTTPEKHQLKIARKSMKNSCSSNLILGGPNHFEAAEIIHKLTGAIVCIDADCTCRR